MTFGCNVERDTSESVLSTPSAQNVMNSDEVNAPSALSIFERDCKYRFTYFGTHCDVQSPSALVNKSWRGVRVKVTTRPFNKPLDKRTLVDDVRGFLYFFPILRRLATGLISGNALTHLCSQFLLDFEVELTFSFFFRLELDFNI